MTDNGGKAPDCIRPISRWEQSGNGGKPSNERGFAHDSIAVLLPDNESSLKFAHEKHTKAPEGATAGAATAGTIDGLIGFMAGAGAPLVFPGVGILLAAGPIASALAG